MYLLLQSGLRVFYDHRWFQPQARGSPQAEVGHKQHNTKTRVGTHTGHAQRHSRLHFRKQNLRFCQLLFVSFRKSHLPTFLLSSSFLFSRVMAALLIFLSSAGFMCFMRRIASSLADGGGRFLCCLAAAIAVDMLLVCYLYGVKKRCAPAVTDNTQQPSSQPTAPRSSGFSRLPCRELRYLAGGVSGACVSRLLFGSKRLPLCVQQRL